jgi:glutamine synthetase
MDVMFKVGERHDFKVFFHENLSKVLMVQEKRNWSLATDTELIYFLQVKHQ